jgi:hypothetical protein
MTYRESTIFTVHQLSRSKPYKGLANAAVAYLAKLGVARVCGSAFGRRADLSGKDGELRIVVRCKFVAVDGQLSKQPARLPDPLFFFLKKIEMCRGMININQSLAGTLASRCIPHRIVGFFQQGFCPQVYLWASC